MHVSLMSLPVGLLVALGVLAVVEITLDVVALVDLYRRPAARVVFGNKWIWVAIIILVNIVGAILYLAIGRKPAAATGPADTASARAATPAPAAESIANSLYGSRDGAELPADTEDR
jgi:hypothetical protein